MRTEISKTYRIEAAHRLPRVAQEHKCYRLHGHSFQITLRIQGDIDPKFDWIVDFGEIDQAWKPIHDAIDHRYLNEIPGLENPTSEILAEWILRRIRLSRGRVVAVSIAETCTASCTVYANAIDDDYR
ncbi:MAG: 6-carboxytetrahydropterin synthase QueD [Deltaproteobacteria bacterium]|nr:6-carboxytetrahydropterin synthase QueD [Deltaproteobacteria bacterium]